MSSLQKKCAKPASPVFFITAIMIQHLFLLACDQLCLHWGSGWTANLWRRAADCSEVLALCQANSVLSFQILIKGANNKR